MTGCYLNRPYWHSEDGKHTPVVCSKLIARAFPRILLVSAFVFLCAFSRAQVLRTIYVSPNGNDANPGTQSQPKRTPYGAIDALRAARMANSKDHFILDFAPGKYFFNQTIEFRLPESGQLPGVPTIVRGVKGQTFFDGSIQVTGWQWADGGIAERVPPSAQPNVYQASLPLVNGLPMDTGMMTRRGYPYDTVITWSTLVFNNQPMTMARYPNKGSWLRLPADHAGSNTTFRMTDTVPYSWVNTGDIWAHGFFGWDWADSFERVGSFNSGAQTVTLATTPAYGMRPTQRYYLVNAIEALDSPGEYFIDRVGRKIYFYAPLEGYTPAQKIDSLNSGSFLTSLDDNLIETYDARDVTFENITFQNGRRGAVDVRYGARVAFKGCTFRRFGTQAALIGSGTDHKFQSCDFYDLDEGALVIHGGNRTTLTSVGHEVVNCWFRDYAKECMAYRVAIDLWGVGHRVANCRIEDAPHSGLVFHGNNHVVERTDFERLCLETIDASAVYIGRNPTFQGNKVTYNRFRDIRSYQTGTHSNFAVGVFLDDMSHGTDVSMNLFYDVQIGVIIGGGRDNRVFNNYFFDNDKSVQVDARGTAWASGFWNEWNIPAMLAEVPYTGTLWRSQYPFLASYPNDQPNLPKRNDIYQNVSVAAGTWLTLYDGLQSVTRKKDQYSVYENFNSVTLGDPGFRNMAAYDYRFDKMSNLAWMKIKTIYPDQIGLYLDSYRTSLP